MFFFTGPVLLILATIFEWIMGNFFSMLLMGMYTVFWLSFGVIETPTSIIKLEHSSISNVVEGNPSAEYNAAVALYLTAWGFWLLTSFVFSLRTNLVFALVFLCGFVSSFVFAASYWKVNTGDHKIAMELQKGGR
jgi:succinate-acetate transporter protein